MCVVGRRGARLLPGRARRRQGRSPLHRSGGCATPRSYGDYLRMATERSLERCGIDSFDLLLLHNPDRIGYTSERVWEGMAALREAGLTRLIGVAPGPANGFTLDLIDCLERFGPLFDWAMIILNPLEPWPGELCLDAAGQSRRERDHPRGRLRRPVLRRRASRTGARAPGPPELPAGGVDRAGSRAPRSDASDRRADRVDHDPAGLPVEPGPRAGRLRRADAHPGDGRGRSSGREQACRARGAPGSSCGSATRMSTAIRAIGDNTGCMALKGANPEHSGEERPDRWDLSDHLAEVAERWGIAPERQPSRRAKVAGAARCSPDAWRRPFD